MLVVKEVIMEREGSGRGCVRSLIIVSGQCLLWGLRVKDDEK